MESLENIGYFDCLYYSLMQIIPHPRQTQFMYAIFVQH